ncbi:unnamed protein product [Ixodes pacificus]
MAPAKRPLIDRSYNTACPFTRALLAPLARDPGKCVLMLLLVRPMPGIY